MDEPSIPLGNKPETNIPLTGTTMAPSPHNIGSANSRVVPPYNAIPKVDIPPRVVNQPAIKPAQPAQGAPIHQRPAILGDAAKKAAQPAPKK